MEITEKQAILTWAREILKEKQHILIDKEETVQENPWSTVIRLSTQTGDIYLKKTPPSLYIEVNILKTLFEQCRACVPQVIASNENLTCFIMNSCGDNTLRNLFNGNLNAEILMKGIEVYKNLQKKCLPHVKHFLKIGVPNWSLEQYPNLYRALLKEELLLLSEGITPQEIEQLNGCYHEFCKLCEALENYKIPNTLCHSDFHDNNIILNLKTERVSIIDVGETAIEHPWFSLAACLGNIENRYQLKKTDSLYLKIKNELFTGWVKNNAESEAIFAIADKLLMFHLILAHIRLIKGTDQYALKAITRMNGRLKNGIRFMISSLMT